MILEFISMFHKFYPSSVHNGNPEGALSSHRFGRRPFNYGSDGGDGDSDREGGADYEFISTSRCYKCFFSLS